MKDAGFQVAFLALLLAASVTGCANRESAPATSTTGTAAPTVSVASGDLPADVVFEHKVACSNAARSFAFLATSPRNHPYVLGRNCYSAALNTCIVEYSAIDESATIFDSLTGEVLVEYLNYPGTADQINLASRIGTATPPSTATTTAEEGDTAQRVDYLRWRAHLFEGCAR